jgi:hypothetical protein
MVDVQRWVDSSDPVRRSLGERWQALICRNVAWKMAVEKTINFHTAGAEATTIFSEPDLVLRRVRDRIPRGIRDIPLKIDVARHYHRPSARLPAGGQNFLADPARGQPAELSDDELFRSLPISFIIFRIYTQDHQHDTKLATALSAVLGAAGDARTNM